MGGNRKTENKLPARLLGLQTERKIIWSFTICVFLIELRFLNYMWDLWWTKWHWDRFLSEYFGFPLSI
jgi:hypothetical protein